MEIIPIGHDWGEPTQIAKVGGHTRVGRAQVRCRTCGVIRSRQTTATLCPGQVTC